jgi:hypothetical protein
VVGVDGQEFAVLYSSDKEVPMSALSSAIAPDGTSLLLLLKVCGKRRENNLCPNSAFGLHKASRWWAGSAAIFHDFDGTFS